MLQLGQHARPLFFAGIAASASAASVPTSSEDWPHTSQSGSCTGTELLRGCPIVFTVPLAVVNDLDFFLADTEADMPREGALCATDSGPGTQGSHAALNSAGKKLSR